MWKCQNSDIHDMIKKDQPEWLKVRHSDIKRLNTKAKTKAKLRSPSTAFVFRLALFFCAFYFILILEFIHECIHFFPPFPNPCRVGSGLLDHSHEKNFKKTKESGP